uniref:FP protein C-terminal domain-containing protein n=1 Tax=Clastoptera arizonana TaxID=38151 RepID=A0A1B6C3I0_9HEMI
MNNIDKSEEEEISEKLDMLISEVRKIKAEQSDMMRSIDLCHLTLNSVTRELKMQCNKLDLCSGDVNFLRSEISFTVNKSNGKLISANDNQQYMRRNIIEIHNVPETNDEDVSQTVIKVISGFGLNLNTSNFCSAYRLPQNPYKPNDPRKISVKFVHHSDKECLMNKRKFKKVLKAKELGYDSSREIYLTDSLTAENRKLLALTREAKTEKGIRYIWTTDGKILIRRNEGGPVKVIRSREDIEAL